MVPDFSRRLNMPEMMDDFSITDVRLTRALEQLRMTNRLLGGYQSTIYGFSSLLQDFSGDELKILDVGTGSADTPEYLLKWCDRRGISVQFTCIDANPVTVAYARAALANNLPSRLHQKIHIEVEDVMALPYKSGSFDIVMASLFLHHFDEKEAANLLGKMRQLSKKGILINDLHRHPLAYYGILAIVKMFPVSPMFKNDGPLSVLRGFQREELTQLARMANLERIEIKWHWAFRWTLVGR